MKRRVIPGGVVVENLPADAGDAGSCPSPRRSHMPRSGWAREPWPLSLRTRSLCSATGETTTVRGLRTAKKKKKKKTNLLVNSLLLEESGSNSNLGPRETAPDSSDMKSTDQLWVPLPIGAHGLWNLGQSP